MILYDQDFNFIGMSSETLTFLGYEDIDEFTSMHNDFADLFIKKEGFIHKFENFSWIHYILYSGAVNKKAYVAKKNGSELCVDITIKEVFLNHAYDGLRMIYSVKLINENFTNISKTDVHDKRSKKSSEFSLKNLTKDLDMPLQQAADSAQNTDIKAPSEYTPAPLDFKLDLHENLIGQEDVQSTVSEESIQTEPPSVQNVDESSFILNLPESEQEEKEEKETTHLDFDMMEEKPTKTAVNAEVESPQTETIREFAFNLFKTDEIVEQEKQEVKALEEPEVDVKDARESIPPIQEEDAQKEHNTSIFHFDLLKNEEEASSEKKVSEVAQITQDDKPQSPVSDFLETLSASDETPQQPIHCEEESAPSLQKAFSFNLFTSPEHDKEPVDKESTTTLSDAKKASLIDQIKSDIEEIDTQIQIDPVEQNNASAQLQELMKVSIASETEVSQEESLDSCKQDELVIEESTFEETLKNIFSIDPSKPKTTEDGEKLKLFDTNTYTDKNKQHIIKEDIKSPLQNDTQTQEPLDIPKLGNLGLSKEEELDFIEEFLDETLATITLVKEYVDLEDYDNIKYNLIKISSSAEILHFDQMFEQTKSLSASCESRDAEAIAEKLNRLQTVANQYKEHFTALAV